MRKFLTAGVVAIAVSLISVGRAEAWSWGHTGPWPQTAWFPCVNPPGPYTNTYYYPWQYPWFAYYNYSHGPYANWMAGQGFAYYRTCNYCGLYGCHHPGGPVPPPPHHPTPKDVKPADVKPEAGQITISLPADAKLLFNGVAATGAGASRTFAIPSLVPGQDYGYDLTAEVVRDGRVETVTERVIVRAGEKTTVTLTPGVVTASGK